MALELSVEAGRDKIFRIGLFFCSAVSTGSVTTAEYGRVNTVVI